MGRTMKPMIPAPDPADSILRDGAVDVAGAVEFTGVGETAIYAAMSSGDIEFLYFGSKRLIARKELVAWLERLHTATASRGRKPARVGRKAGTK